MFADSPHIRIVPALAGGILLLLLAAVAPAASTPQNGGGLFPWRTDIGAPNRPGTFEHDPLADTYQIGGGGSNMWFGLDALHFAWTQLAGDWRLTADITWPRAGGNAHRKACLIVRSNLDADAVYADAALHGDGLTSLQFREEQGGATHEVQANVTGPATLRLERCGDVVSLKWAGKDGALKPGGGSVRLALQEPAFVGLGVCAHDDTALEEAVFSNVRLERLSHRTVAQPSLESTLEFIDIASKDRRAVYVAPEHLEAPVWSADAKSIAFKRRGGVSRAPLVGGEPVVLDAAAAAAYTQALHEGPQPSPDATWLYFTSAQEGRTHLWRMRADGSSREQLTHGDASDGFPHPSPDGKWVAFLSFSPGPVGTMPDQQVQLCMIPAGGGNAQLLARFQGGAGTLNAPSWSPDSRRLAYVSYRLIHH